MSHEEQPAGKDPICGTTPLHPPTRSARFLYFHDSARLYLLCKTLSRRDRAECDTYRCEPNVSYAISPNCTRTRRARSSTGVNRNMSRYVLAKACLAPRCEDFPLLPLLPLLQTQQLMLLERSKPHCIPNSSRTASTSRGTAMLCRLISQYG